MIRSWKTLSSRSLGKYPVFALREVRRESPRNGAQHDFIVLDAVNWVNVVAVTPDDHVVLIEQYRHGSETVELEVPGGVMDATDASPAATGIRELREETGYEGERARIIGSVWANPAIMSNTCYTVLIEQCRLKHQLDLDHTEDLVTRLVPADEIPALVAQGKITHSLVVVALNYFDLWKRGLVKNAS